VRATTGLLFVCAAVAAVGVVGCGDSAGSASPTNPLQDVTTVEDTGSDTSDPGLLDTGIDPGPTPDASDASTPDVRGDAADGTDATDTGGNGEVGDPCAADVDCESDICIPITSDGSVGVCSDFCLTNEECPPDFECLIIPQSGDDEQRLCVATTLCIDEDGDDYGVGPGCAGADCDDTTDVIHVSADELCDGLDNDCDGNVDENAIGIGELCETGFSGPCASGRRVCQAGGLTCVSDVAPTPEVCDSVDNDCDGEIDNNPSDVSTWYADADGDRFGDNSSTVIACDLPAGYESVGGDCNDAVRAVNPTALEVCDGVDNNCDGNVDGADSVGARSWYVDLDGDGVGAGDLQGGCTAPENGVERDGDCDDTRDDVFPRAAEVCDGVDNDCDGGVDEDGLSTWFADVDGDGFGDAGVSVEVCGRPAGYVAVSGDCDDATFAVNPDATEVCNGVDDDCDGGVDEPDATDALVWYPDFDADTYGATGEGERLCDAPAGYVLDGSDCDDSSGFVNVDAEEFCDGIDNNCLAGIDEDSALDALLQYTDGDNDGYGNAGRPAYACELRDGFSLDNADCDDRNALNSPVGTEACDGADNDCDGETDEGAAVGATSWYADTDGDSWGAAGSSLLRCAQPVGYVSNATDCNDANSAVNPAAAEACNGLDDDCDTDTDEGAALGSSRFYADADGDTFGSPTAFLDRCVQPAGYVTNTQDCNDANNLVNPSAAELCNGFDDNCSGTVDEGSPSNASTWFRDADGDTFGTPLDTRRTCAQPAGYVASSADCNDGSSAVNPLGTESCNGADDDCDGQTDEGEAVGSSTWYADNDGDSFGNASSTLLRCGRPGGYVADNTDCNDGNNLVNPGRAELCNGIDDNCAGGVDEGSPGNAPVWYRDQDGDTWGNPSQTLRVCAQPAGYIARASDCNDSLGGINPGASEVVGDDVDQNCDEAEICFVDADDDGFRLTSTIASANSSCGDSGEARSSEPTGDCDDAVGTTRPGAADTCNLVDDNCDGSVDNTGGSCTVGIHRFRNSSGFHFYASNLVEGPAAGYTLQNLNYFYLYNVPAPGLVPFYRCFKNDGGHLFTTDPTCELLGPSQFEGQIGWIAPGPSVPGTTRLWRAYRSGIGDHLFTISNSEFISVIQTGGYTGEPEAGYVFTAPR
jgi:hypothetical protein